MDSDEIFGKEKLILGLLEMNNNTRDIEKDERSLAVSLVQVRGTYVYSLVDSDATPNIISLSYVEPLWLQSIMTIE